MKRLHIIVLCALLAVSAAVGQRNRFTMQDFEIAPDSTVTIPLLLAHQDTSRGVQFNMTPPLGLYVKAMQLTSYSKSLGMSLSSNEKNGIHTVIIYQVGQACFPPDTAEILNVKFQAGPDFKGGELEIWKGRGSTMDNATYVIDGDTALVTVPSSWLIGIPIDQQPVQEHFFNLQGQPIDSPASVPVAIEVTTMSDGHCTSRKVAVR